MASLFKTKEPMTTSAENVYQIEGANEQINQFLVWLQITEKDLENVRLTENVFLEYIDPLAERHYEMIMMIPELKVIMEEHSYYERYISLVKQYFSDLPKASLTKEHVSQLKKIGKVHSKIGLQDEWYIGSYIRAFEFLLPVFIRKFKRKPSLLQSVLYSLLKIITFDIMVVISSTQEETDDKLIQSISTVMEYVMGANKMLDLSKSVDATMEETASVSAATEQLQAAIEQVTNNAANVSEHAEEVVTEAINGKSMIEGTLADFLMITEEFKTTKEKIDDLIEPWQVHQK